MSLIITFRIETFSTVFFNVIESGLFILINLQNIIPDQLVWLKCFCIISEKALKVIGFAK